MFTFIGKLFATLTSACNSLHILATVGEDYCVLVKEEANHKLKLKRLELAKQISLEPAA